MAETIIEFISILLTLAYVVIGLSFIRGWNRLPDAEAVGKDSGAADGEPSTGEYPGLAVPAGDLSNVSTTAAREPGFVREYRTRVSVLIAARNEEQSIGRSLDAVLAQRYPAELLEVIVIDDHSTDRTAEIVTSYQQRGEVSVEGRPALRLLRMNEHKPINSYKKKAIARADRKSTRLNSSH